MCARQNPTRELLVVFVLILAVVVIFSCSDDSPTCPKVPRVLQVAPTGEGSFKTIQDAIDNARDGDTIVMADGCYYGPGNRDIDFLGKAVTLRSMSMIAQACTIDCQGSEEDPHRAFYFHSGEEQTTVVEYVTVVNGYTDSDGGGLLCDFESSPTLRGLVVADCTAGNHGGGLCAKDHSQALIKSCQFISNTAGGGGGISCSGGSVHILDTRFEGNIGGLGGGLEIWIPFIDEPSVEGCTFTNNTGRSGGAVFVQSAEPTIKDCLSSNNYGDFGGFIFCHEAAPIVLRCISFADTTDHWGSSLHCQGRCEPHLISCTFTHGLAEMAGSVVHLHDNSDVSLTRCIVSFCTNGQAVACSDAQASCTFTCSDIFGNELGNWTNCIEGQSGIQGNISADPLFCDPVGGDLHLRPGSPCSGDSSDCGQMGALPVVCDY